MHLFHKWTRWETCEAVFQILLRYEVPDSSKCGKIQTRTLG